MNSKFEKLSLFFGKIKGVGLWQRLFGWRELQTAGYEAYKELGELVVLLDDVGYAQFGCYGSDVATPTFDKLAVNGLRYSNYHTTALCSPTRAALLTGRNPHSVGMGRVADIVSGLYQWSAAPSGLDVKHRSTILFSGSAQGAAIAAAEELRTRFNVAVDLWSATSYKTLREDALAVERHNRLHPSHPPKVARVTALLSGCSDPVIAVSDFMKIVPEQIARFVPGRSFTALGTDGMGRSDTRDALRSHFEIDMPNIVVTVLAALAQSGAVSLDIVQQAIAKYDIKPSRTDPYIV